MIRAAVTFAACCQAFHLCELAARAYGGHRAFAGNEAAALSVLEAIRDA